MVMLRFFPRFPIPRRWVGYAALPGSLILLSGCVPREIPVTESSPVVVSPSPVVSSPVPTPSPVASASPTPKPVQSVTQRAAVERPAPRPKTAAQPPRLVDSSKVSIATGPTSGALLERSQADVGGIRLGATEAEVRQMMGEPASQREEQTGCCGILRSLTFNDLTVSLIEGNVPGKYVVYSLASRNPEMATADGIRIGSSRQQVTATYGTPSRESTEGGVTHLVYDVGEAASFLTFGLQGDRVIEMGYDSLLN
jgi:hypothetical protein